MPPRTPLRDAGGFYRDLPDWAARIRTPLLVGAGSVALVVVAYYAVSLAVAEFASGTVVVDNPAYPGDRVCDSFVDRDRSHSSCSEPATVERTQSAVLSEAVWNLGSTLSLGTFMSAVGAAIVIGSASFKYHGRKTVVNSLHVAAWGTVPFALALSLNAPIIGYMVLQGDVPADVGDVYGRYAPLMGVTMIGATLWATYLWYAGTRLLHDFSDRQATITAGGLFVSAVALTFGLYGV